MILDVTKGDRGILVDGNGEEVKDCVRADTETGECIVLARDENGKIRFSWDAVILEKVMRPLPMTFTRREIK